MRPLDYRSTSKSYLYELLSTYGVTQSTEVLINEMRGIVRYEQGQVLNKTVGGKLYHSDYTRLPASDYNKVELWVNGEHLNLDQYRILTEESAYATSMVPVLLDRAGVLSVRYFVNKNIIHREYKTNKESIPSVYTYKYEYDANVHNITENSIYAIADSKFIIPSEVNIQNGTIIAKFPYEKTLDIFLCRNLICCAQTNPKGTVLVTDRTDPSIYGTYLLDTTESAQLDVRFYPFVNVSAGGFLRVFSDIKVTVKPDLLPYVRYINYPEFNHVKDPYDFGWANSSMVFSKEKMIPSDSDAEIYRKFTDIGKEYYRIKDIIAPRTPVFKMYDSCFVSRTLILPGNTSQQILVATIPFDDYQDILFYRGEVFSDYSVDTIKEIDNTYVEINPNGLPKYYISDTAENRHTTVDFSILKINTKNNTTIKAISNDVAKGDKDGTYPYAVEFSKNIRTMYKNLLALQEYRLNLSDENKVVLSEEESVVYKDYTWFEILSIDNPEEFENVVKTLIRSGTMPNPETGGDAIWFDSGNTDPTTMYHQLLLTDDAQVPDDGSAILFDLSVPVDVATKEEILAFIEDNEVLISEMLSAHEETADLTYLDIVNLFTKGDVSQDPTLRQLWLTYSELIDVDDDVVDQPIELVSRIIWLGLNPPSGEESARIWFDYNDPTIGQTSMLSGGAGAGDDIFDKDTLSNLYLDNPMVHPVEYTDIFAEWVNAPLKRVIMWNGQTIIAAINETIMKIELSNSSDSEYLDLFIFDDIALNFRKANKGELRYNGILPDLLNSEIIDESALIVFDKILKDSRLTKYLSLENNHDVGNVIMNESSYENSDELNVVYSNSIKRYVILREDLSETDVAELDMMIVPINDETIYYDNAYFAMFINGQYIQASKILPLTDNNRHLKITGFDGVIERVDLIYNGLDEPIYRLKNCLFE